MTAGLASMRQDCMNTLHAFAVGFFDRVILRWPKTVLLCLALVVAFFAYHAKDFQLDASTETLLMENDPDLRYWREVIRRYGSEDFIFITYHPRKVDLLSTQSLERLARLKAELEALPRVESVLSILDVPLLESPPIALKDLAGDLPTITSQSVDRNLAREEFASSPLYRNLLVSPDLKTTALRVTFESDTIYMTLIDQRDTLKARRQAGDFGPEQAEELALVETELDDHRDHMRQVVQDDIAAIRAIMDHYRDDAELFLGGISMIASDLVTFIRDDLKMFGLGVLVFLVIMLTVIFRRPRWVLLPMLCCLISVVTMIGVLGLSGWEVTVISSNFISLQLIITMAVSIHLIVRYRDLRRQNPQRPHRDLVLDSVRFMMIPCLYAATTTIAGFGSLLLSDIRPVINFGWMMSAGIIISNLLTFILLPTVLVLLKEDSAVVEKPPHFTITPHLAHFTEGHGTLILVVAIAALLASVVGVSRLQVENSFINYFKSSTEIYKGMLLIDQQLGGTTPLDVIIRLPEDSTPVTAVDPDEFLDEAASAPAPDSTPADETAGVFDTFDEFDEAPDDDKYWFTAAKMARVEAVHDYLESLPATGKVISLGTMAKVARKFNKGETLDNFQLALIYTEMPDDIREMVLAPYVSVADNEVRFTIRIKDSLPDLRRNALLEKIKADLVAKFGFTPEQVRLGGMMVLYNNMLQSLFRSQISTLGVALAALLVMFFVLFRSLKVSLIAITPNLLAIFVVLGFMGWMEIPLDMMTITIAAISIGMAVDNTIHYIYRFIHEFAIDGRYLPTMHRCHSSIGYALFYTSITVIVGFSILILSNFIPSIMFGLLTGLALLMALLAALTLLPRLIVMIKPFGPEAPQP
jgi:predicted RND superfamily exporter protein